MYAFVVKRVPLSYNAKHKHTRYKDEIAAAFHNQGFAGLPLAGSLYSRVYYFHSVPSALDADNMSKPIVDALKNHAYADDNVVIHRTAAIMDMRKTTINELSLSHVPENVLLSFLEALDNECHVLYIEVGQYGHEMLHFGGVH